MSNYEIFWEEEFAELNGVIESIVTVMDYDI
jgi:hypothetical protein